MKKDPRQLEFDFSERGVIISPRFYCDHLFDIDPSHTGEWCFKCGLMVPHEYIVEHLNVTEWGYDEL